MVVAPLQPKSKVWLLLFGFSNSLFSGGEKWRQETRLCSQAPLQPWRDKKDCDGDYLTVNWRMLKNTRHGVSDPLEDNSLCRRTPISSIKQTIEEIENGIKLFYFELKLHTSVTMDSPARNIKQQVISEKSSLRWPRRSLCANLSTVLVIALSTSTNWKKEQMWILVVGLVIRKMVKFNQGLNQILSLAVLSKNM